MINKGSLPTVGILNLGCVRNIVDSQLIAGRLQSKGYAVKPGAEKIDIVIINTCGFIEGAKEESIDVILRCLDLKQHGRIQKVIVAGCLSQRYALELIRECPQIDAVVGVLALEKTRNLPQKILTPRHYAYVKICESCLHHCSFCAIPQIKGSFLSRSIHSILEEIEYLDYRRTKEIILIGQDTTSFGLDCTKRPQLTRLLKQILKKTRHIRWIRILYAYPSLIDEELLDLMSEEERICSYLDIPLQHISDRILKKMNRPFLSRCTRNLIEQVRSKVSGICLRTSLMVGFPGETESEFQELCEFVSDMQFNRLGVFPYSQEEGTKAAKLPQQVAEAVKKRRVAHIMRLQRKISRQNLKRFIGTIQEIVIDERDPNEENIYVGRTRFDAPEVDGSVLLSSQKRRAIGSLVKVKITDSYEYDLIGQAL